MIRWAIWRFVIFATAALTAGSAIAQTTAEWLAPLSGSWVDSTKWSTAPSYPKNNTPSFGTRYDVSIDAVGSPYQVSLAESMYVDRITIDSPDATLLVSAGTLDTVLGIHVERGKLLLDGATLYLDRLSSGPDGILMTGATLPTNLYGVTLAGDLQAERHLTIGNTLTLENGTVRFASGNIHGGADILGSGEWVLKSTLPRSANFPYRVYFYEQGSNEMRIGPDVTVRSVGEVVSLVAGPAVVNNPGIVVNQGTIIAETNGGSFYISDFRNEGLIRISNGDYMSAGFRGAVGNVELGDDSHLRIYDAPQFNLPLVVGSGAYLDINAEQQATASQPLQLAEGGRILFGTPLSIVPVDSSGGQISLDGNLTLTKLNSLNVTGPAPIQFAGGSLDLEGSTFDYTTAHPNLVFAPPIVKNGRLTGPATQFGNSATFHSVELDVPLAITTSTVQLQTNVALLQPANVSGGRLVLGTDWRNPGGIAVSGGVLQLDAPAAEPGEIDMTGGLLYVAHDANLSDLLALDFGTPERVVIGNNLPWVYYGGDLDLEGATLDLDAFDFDWATEQEGGIQNGEIVGTHSGRSLSLSYSDNRNLTVRGVKLNTVSTSFITSTLIDVWSTVPMNLTQTTIVDSRVDGDLTGSGIVLQGQNEVYGRLGGTVRFDPDATITGAGYLGFNSGRSGGDVYTFVDPEFVLPASFDLVMATQYSAYATVEASNTDFVVEGKILVGHDTATLSTPDSWTLRVASLRTNGEVTVTSDGRLLVEGGLWMHEGEMHVAGGTIQAPQLEVAAGAAVEGWGTISVDAGGLQLAGALAPGGPEGELAINGDVAFASTAQLAISLRGSADANPASFPVDRLDVVGMASLDGSLEVTLTPDFFQQPFSIGDQFEFITATAVTGQFDVLISNYSHIAFQLIYSDTSVLLEIVDLTTVPGDYNQNGTVDAADYTVWRDNLGRVTALPNDDTPGVDFDDYARWKMNFGTTFGEGGGSVLPSDELRSDTVPESGLSLVAALGIAAIIKLRVPNKNSR